MRQQLHHHHQKIYSFITNTYKNTFTKNRKSNWDQYEATSRSTLISMPSNSPALAVLSQCHSEGDKQHEQSMERVDITNAIGFSHDPWRRSSAAARVLGSFFNVKATNSHNSGENLLVISWRSDKGIHPTCWRQDGEGLYCTTSQREPGRSL